MRMGSILSRRPLLSVLGVGILALTVQSAKADLVDTSWLRYINASSYAGGTGDAEDQTATDDSELFLTASVQLGAPPPPPTNVYYLIQQSARSDVSLVGNTVNFTGQLSGHKMQAGTQPSQIVGIGGTPGVSGTPGLVQDQLFFTLESDHTFAFSGSANVPTFLGAGVQSVELRIFSYTNISDPFGSETLLYSESFGPGSLSSNFSLTGELEAGLYFIQLVGVQTGSGDRAIGSSTSHLNSAMNWDASATFTAVPEPSATLLLGLGTMALLFRRRAKA